MSYKAIDVANYVIDFSNKEDIPISNLKLQKVLYYIQAASLIKNERPMFSDEIVAWKYGPVVEEVYHAFKINANDAIRKPTDFDYKEEIISDDEELIKEVVLSYKGYSAIEIMQKTCKEFPWKNAITNGTIIENASIQKHYQNK